MFAQQLQNVDSIIPIQIASARTCCSKHMTKEAKGLTMDVNHFSDTEVVTSDAVAANSGATVAGESSPIMK